jgi:hypothetical protein
LAVPICSDMCVPQCFLVETDSRASGKAGKRQGGPTLQTPVACIFTPET